MFIQSASIILLVASLIVIHQFYTTKLGVGQLAIAPGPASQDNSRPFPNNEKATKNKVLQAI
jgi:hypothetical protein